MKILYSHRTRSADGQYVHIRALTDSLLSRGHNLQIVGPEGVVERATRSLDAQASAAVQAEKKWKMPKPIYEMAEMGYSIPAYNRLASTAKTFAPDILYERYNLYYHAGLWLKKKMGLPLILEVNSPLREERMRHGGLALQGMAKRSEETLWRAADVVLPVTGVLAKKIIDAGVPEEKIQVIQNGVDTAFLKEQDASALREKYGLKGRLVLGFTGFVRDWHGVDRILNFMAANPDRNLHLMLVGDGPARAELEEQARALNIEDRFTVTGIVQRDTVPSYVSLFDVALQPAVVAYASPLKLFEYMAMAKPILAPASANISEVLTADHDSLLFAQDNEGAFRKNLLALVSKPDLRMRLGAAARKTLETQDYTWAGNAGRVERIAESLLGQ